MDKIVPFIDIQQVTYTYPVAHLTRSAPEAQAARLTTPALRGTTLGIESGEFVALLGHNGSGKSTLARMCNALLLPESGRVLVAGLDTSNSANTRAVRDSVGMIFQNPDNQLIATVVEDDVAWALTVRGLSRQLIRERVEEALEAVHITHLRHLPPQKLSGGQRQRLAIAGVLALRPRCIIADEATSMLDPLSRIDIVALLHDLHQRYGLTIIQVTHLLEETALAQRAIVMEQGQVVLDTTPVQLFSNLDQVRALQLEIPEPLQLAERLRATGMTIARSALTIQAIAEELAP